MTVEIQKLKSGSDIRGVAIAGGDKPARLTEEVGVSVGRAFSAWLSERAQKPGGALRVAVGRDSRLSGERLAEAIMDGLAQGGTAVLDAGLCTTPAMFMTTRLLDVDGAVMVTASHMPMEYNGYKFFTRDGGLEGADIADILRYASQGAAAGPQAAVGQRQQSPFLPQYSAFLAGLVRNALGEDAPLAGLHVVVDAGNGAGGFYADLLRELGADVSGSQFLSPDGSFPNHIPNPEAEEAMTSISRATAEAGADLGVIFDADCDRAALVDEAGRPINRNRLIALTAAMLLRETPGITVVSDSVTSYGLDRFVAARGGHLHRFRRGYRNVIDEARRLCAAGIACPLAMETSGHAAFSENFFQDDGMYLVTRLLIEAMREKRAGRTLCALIDGLAEPAESAELRLPIRADDYRPIGEAVVARAAQMQGFQIDPENREGIRMWLDTPECWFLLRLSVHDPLLVLNAESGRQGGISAMLAALLPVIAAFPAVDASAIGRHPLFISS